MATSDGSAGARTARVHVLVNEELDGRALVHPAAAPGLAAIGYEADAMAELSLFLREHFARTPPEAKSRLSLPAGARLVEVGVALPDEEEAAQRRKEPEIPVTFPCVVVLAKADSGAVWVLVPVLDHAFYVEEEEPIEPAIRAEIKRLVGARDATAWDRIGLLPPREARLEVREIPLSGDAEDAEKSHAKLAERARRKQARATLARVATPLSEVVRRGALPPLTARENETAALAALLDGKERLGVLLVGPEQAGKSALVRAYAAAASRAVWSTSGAQLVAGMSGLGQWQQRVREVMEAIAEIDGVLYFESLDDLLAERVESGGVDFAGAMRPFIDDGKVRLVAEIRDDRLDGAEGRHVAFFSVLSRLRVQALSVAETRRALDQRAAHDARVAKDRPRVSPEALAPLVDLAERYLPYGAFPGKALRLYEDLRAAHDRDGAGDAIVIGKRELYRLFSITTGVPEMLLRDDAPLLIEDVAASLRKQIIGQDDAVMRLAETIGVVKAGLQPAGKPLATFLFIGPTGVGKTELARALASILFGAPDRMVRFDMSEFMTPDAAERLIRGSDSADGLLTRRVREQPFCVLLLDEIEKAHAAVFDLLLQVCGEGRLTDARGRTAYFHNAILIMTSNLGAAERRTPTGFSAGPTADLAHYQRLVQTAFRQEMVGRIDRIVPFRSLTRAELSQVARLGLEKLAMRSGLAESGSRLVVSDAAIEKLATDGYSETYGARAQRRHIDERVAAPLARMIAALGGEAKDLTIEVTLVEEIEPVREGVFAGSLESQGYKLTARRAKRAQKVSEARGHAEIADLRRVVDQRMNLASVTEMRDHRDFLLTQLNLSDKEKADRRIARDLVELSSDHHRLSELWNKLVAAQEELHAIEELSIVALFEGQSAEAFCGEAEKAFAAHARVLPYALVALLPRRDAITWMIEELDAGAIRPWMEPLIEVMRKRGWSAVVHVYGGDRVGAEEWPADRVWGPPRSMDWLLAKMETPVGGSLRHLLLRVRGPYAGVLLALEAGLHRRTPAKRSSAALPEDEADRMHVNVRTMALAYEVPEDAWTPTPTSKPLQPPHISGAPARRRARAARELDETTGEVRADGCLMLGIDPAVYWAHLDGIALRVLLEIADGSISGDTYFAPAMEDAS